MRIAINRNTLAQALADVTPFINPKVSMPILNGIKVTTKGNRIKFEASDTQAVIRKYVVAEEVDQDGTFVADAVLCKYIQKVKGDTVTIEHDGNTLTVKHSNGNAEFNTMPADEYPVFNMPNSNVTEVELDSNILADAISTAKGFVGTDDFHAPMKTIYAFIKDGVFGYCATDTRVMIANQVNVDTPATIDTHWSIEPFVFSALVRHCNKCDGAVKIQIADTHVLYRIGDTVIQTSQTKGNFPKYEKVIPQSWNIECHVDRGDMVESLNRAVLMCENTLFVKLDVTDTDISVCADNLATIRRTKETIPHNGCNGSITIGMNADYLLTCLSACSSSKVALRFGDASRPVLIYQESHPNMAILSMPMSISN